MNSINPAQLKRLQTSWGQYARRTIFKGDEREERLRWASEAIGRKIASFKDLTFNEAMKLIRALNGMLGIAEKQRRQRMTRETAMAAGTEGRRGKSATVTLASADDLAAVYELVAQLGWDQDRFEKWLRSTSSPLARRAEDGTRIPPPEPTIRTLGQANRIRWALKNMLRRRTA